MKDLQGVNSSLIRLSHSEKITGAAKKNVMPIWNSFQYSTSEAIESVVDFEWGGSSQL